MKQLLVTDVLGEDSHVVGNDFDDSAEIELTGCLLRVADGNQCVLLNVDSFASLIFRPVEVAIKNPCGKDCGCHDDKADAQFDCKGACKNRCYDCANQDRIAKGEGNDPA